MRDTSENCNSLKWAKDKTGCWLGGKSVMGDYQAKHSKQGYDSYADLSQLPSPVIRDLVLLLFLAQRGSRPYKRRFSL